MPLTINTNTASLGAQKTLSSNQSALQASIARLSSGMRINNAGDDAAGMAISTRMTSQIRGLGQAARNANDGISLVQTADNALGSVAENLQRIRELAVQSSNASNSATDRTAINAEATQLVAEIDRVATTTQFNGVNVLDGTFLSKSFQVGANSGQTVSISSIASARSNALGVGSATSYSATVNVAATPSAPAALTAGGITINGYNVGASVSDGVSTAGGTYSAISKANAINAISSSSGVTATAKATTVTYTAGNTGGAWDVSINGVQLTGTSVTNASVNASDFAAKVNAVSAQTGVTATFETATDTYTLTAADGRNIDVTATTAGDTGSSTATNVGGVTLSSTSSEGIVLGGAQATAAIFGAAAGKTAATSSLTGGMSAIDLSSASGAASALTTIDAALNQVNSSRANLGAMQNRFESIVSNLDTFRQNQEAARSRIMDTDFAKETTNMTRNQILTQAGTAMLAQANQLPQSVLKLLQ